MSMIFSSDSKYKICQHGRYKYACKLISKLIRIVIFHLLI